jgi:glucose/arabinose dehydrogenase
MRPTRFTLRSRLLCLALPFVVPLLTGASCAPSPEAGETVAQTPPAGAPAASSETPAAPGEVYDAGLPLDSVRLPEGFRIGVYAEVPKARSLTLSPNGVVYVGNRKGDSVYALRDGDGDGRAESVTVVDSGLDAPNGVAWKDGALYVAEVHRILRYDGIDERLESPPEPVVVTDDYPTDRHHGWKFIAFGPDGWLYVPVGAPCNVCESDEIYASITRIRPDGSGREIYARGIRNTVGFDWHPQTGELWFTENGRDRMGDDVPPDEINRAPKPGMHFGFPYCHGDVPDPELGSKRPCSEFTPPELELGAHVAALGMRFYTGGMFPADYRGDVLFAEHGSWNRSQPIGYRVMRVRMEGSKAVSAEPFASGWLPEGGSEGDPWGRPVDVLQMPDGALLVSDDEAGVVYRIWYEG